MAKSSKWADVKAKAGLDPADLAAARDMHLDIIRAYRLREIRERKELTQAEVAEVMGVTPVRISQIEHGQVDRSNVTTLASYVAALGGRLRLVADFGEETFVLGDAEIRAG